MKLNLPSIVDNHNVLPGVANDANAGVDEAASIVGPDAGLAINQASTNNAPDAPENADDPNANAFNVLVLAVPTHPNVVLAPSNVAHDPLIDLPVPPNPPDVAAPLGFVGVQSNASTAPSAPTAEETPTNVVVKMEQIVNEDVVLVRNKKYKEIMVVVLDDDDEDEDVAGE